MLLVRYRGLLGQTLDISVEFECEFGREIWEKG